MCKQVGLDYTDMEHRTIGSCLDYIEEYVAQQNPKKRKKKQKTRIANQSDFDKF